MSRGGDGGASNPGRRGHGASGHADVGPGGAGPTIAPAADLLAAAALWGGMYVVSAATFSRVPPVTLGLLRLAVGVAVLAVALRFRLGFRRETIRRVSAAGLIVAATLVLQFVGTSLTGGAEGALLTTTTPAFVLLLGVAFDREAVRPAAWIGVLIALVGVGLVASRNASAGVGGDPLGHLLGDGLLVASAATWALFSWVGRPLVVVHGAFRAILQASCIAIPVLVPLAAIELANGPRLDVDGAAVLAIAYLGVGATALAWSLWYRGYAAAPATLAAGAFFAQPLVGALLGGLVLHEAIDARFVAGAALIAAGILALVAPTASATAPRAGTRRPTPRSQPRRARGSSRSAPDS